ncbi:MULTISPECIES: hypothetical protein [Priestia]|uniref:hypothetical protein n=1 Tax=Priestia TaxID=2800373 RepID=UPI001ADB8A22|nr:MULTISPECIES: hypothetical protein [Priestia]QTL51400.1 hypothetical protein J5Z55_10120 [Priestia aryabhattai]USL44356.1 hypothetical protein LIS78_09975 [Priestia megaterium]
MASSKRWDKNILVEEKAAQLIEINCAAFFRCNDKRRFNVVVASSCLLEGKTPSEGKRREGSALPLESEVLHGNQ